MGRRHSDELLSVQVILMLEKIRQKMKLNKMERQKSEEEEREEEE